MTDTVTHLSPDAPAIVWGFGADRLSEEARAAAERILRGRLAHEADLADATDVRIHRSSSPVTSLTKDEHGLERFVVTCKANDRTISPDETGTMLLLVWHDDEHWELHLLTKQVRKSGADARKHA